MQRIKYLFLWLSTFSSAAIVFMWANSDQMATMRSPVTEEVTIVNDEVNNEKENETLFSEIKFEVVNANDTIIVYHKVQKTGSTTFESIFASFCANRSFTYKNYPSGRKDMNKQTQVKLVREVLGLRPRPAIFSKVFYFIDFASRGAFETPLFFGVVRDPVKRFVSYFNYIRHDAHNWGSGMYRRYFRRYHKTINSWRKQSVERCILKQQYDCKLDTWQKDFYLTIPYFCGKQQKRTF